MVKTATTIAETLPLSPAERADAVRADKEMVELRARRDAGVPSPRSYRKLTEARWAAFIACVRQIGNARHAAALADGDRAWTTCDTYLSAMRADPLRQREYDGAVAHFEARISRELIRRGVEGFDIAKWHDGEIVGYEKQYDSKIALALASHHLRLIEKRSDVSVTTHSADTDQDVLFSLSWDTVSRMPADVRKRLLAPLLEWVRADRAKLAGSTIAEHDLPMIEADDAANKTALDFSWLDAIEIPETAE